MSIRESPSRLRRRVEGNSRATAYSAAPATSASAPDRRCCGVAPARIASAITIASAGISGPKGNVNIAGVHRGGEARLPQPERRRAGEHVDDQPADRADRRQRREPAGQRQHQRHRRGDENRGDRRAEPRVHAAEERGRSPCSASAKRLRVPDNAWPMLLPDVDTSRRRSSAPRRRRPGRQPPRSASGVCEAAQAGSVPSATTCTSVMIAVTMAIVMISANGTARRGSFASPADTGTTS